MWTLTRILCRLRWRYMWSTSWKRRIGVIAMFAMSIMFAIWLSILMYFGLRAASPESESALFRRECLVAGAFIIYVGWIYFGSFNDLYDPQKLATYPIPPRRLFTCACASSILGAAPIFIIAMVAGTTAAMEGGIIIKIVRGLFIVALAMHLIMLGRLVRLVFLQILTSRRWREFSGLLGMLMSGVIWVAMASGSRLQSSETSQEIIRWIHGIAADGDLSIWTCWIPATWWAWAFNMEGALAPVGAFLFVLSSILIARAGGWSEEKIAFSEPVFAYAPKKTAPGAPRRRFLRGWPSGFLKFFGGDIAAVVKKEFCVLARDPLVRMRFMSTFFMIIVMGVIPILSPRRSMSAGSFPLGGILVFAQIAFLFNLFGTDGLSIRALFISPMDRGRMLVAKSLAYVFLFIPFNLSVILVIGLFSKRADLAEEMGYHICYFLITLSAGHIFSIYFPTRLVQVGKRVQRDSDVHPIYRALTGIFALLTTGIAAAPVILGRYVVSPFFDTKGEIIIFIISTGYALLLYSVSLKIAGLLLARREDKLLAFFSQNN
ncbi:MAG: hypothetical protein HY286_12715 [Planctomycetes bacterium]|nr:hypothetical protein [Planctomycetota bacterium]